MMDKGCIVALVLPRRRFLFLLPNCIHLYAIIMQYISYLDKRKVLQQGILPFSTLPVGSKLSEEIILNEEIIDFPLQF